MKTILQIHGLSKRVNGKVIVDDVGFCVTEGEVVSLIGPSGGGKTSIIRIVGGLESFDMGSLTIAGSTIESNSDHDLRKEARKHMSIVFQEYNIWPHMTVLENVIKPLLLTKNMNILDAKELGLSWLRKVKLEHKANAYPKSLSGGQKQRVAIARALAYNPKILLLDEITSALDPELTSGILNLLRILALDGVTMLIVTHHLEFARQVSDRILFIDEGKIVEETTPDIFFNSTDNKRIKQFIASLIKYEKDVAVYEGEEEFQAYWIGKLNMLPCDTVGYVLGAVGDKWFESMNHSYTKYIALMRQKSMQRKMLGYAYTDREKIARNELGDLFDMRIIATDVKPLANFNIWHDTLMIQVFDTVPKVIEIKNKLVVESYMNYFNFMRGQGTPVDML